MVRKISNCENEFLYLAIVNLINYLAKKSDYINQTFFYTFYLKDHLGNIRVTIDEDGSVVTADDYYPFGLQMPGRSYNVAFSGNQYKFGSKEWDDENNLNWYHFDARRYDPEIARWMVVDPLTHKYPSLSPYVYVLNNPINAYDPDGQDVAILNDPSGAFRQGHNAILVGNDDDGWEYYSKNGPGTQTQKHYDKFDDFINDDTKEAKRYSNAVRIPTTHDQDDAAKKVGNVLVNTPYDVCYSNCADLVSAIANAAEVDLGNNRKAYVIPYKGGFITIYVTRPNTQYSNAKKLAKKKKGSTVYDLDEERPNQKVDDFMEPDETKRPWSERGRFWTIDQDADQ